MDNLLELIEKAESGDINAMYNVALYCIYGDLTRPVEPEIAERSLRYFQYCVAAGDCDAMLDLAAMYLNGRGVPEDREKAFSLYQMAIDKEYPKAYRCMGNLYYYNYADDGRPIKTSDPVRIGKAYEYFVRGADLGEQNCLYELGDMYLRGICTDKDEKKAFSLYIRSWDTIEGDHFDDSYSDVALRLGECYHHGLGTAVNLKKALEYLTIAKDECRRRYDEGDMYGGGSLERATEEWISVLTKLDNE